MERPFTIDGGAAQKRRGLSEMLRRLVLVRVVVGDHVEEHEKSHGADLSSGLTDVMVNRDLDAPRHNRAHNRPEEIARLYFAVQKRDNMDQRHITKQSLKGDVNTITETKVDQDNSL